MVNSKILLVDDLKDNLLALEGLLRHEGIDIFKAKSGTEALELMMVHEFAVALVDVQMPGMSGFELAELMRGAKKTKSIPIIFVTATAKEQSFMFKGYESGAVDFLLKPLDTHAVKSKVNIFIELYRQKKKQEELLSKLKKTQGELEQAVQIREDLMSIASDELKIRKSQLKQGVEREKLAEEQFRQQTDELESKEGQLKEGSDREKFAEKQIHSRNKEIEEQREELLHVTRVGKLAEFVSSLAHEISQPLTAILSYAQAAQRMYAGRDPQLEEILQYIINDDQRAAEVIRQLRSMLKKNKPAFGFFDINALIKDTVSLIMTHITRRKKIVKFNLCNGLPFIFGDRIQLQQVLLNLVSNSLEAMDETQDSCELLINTSLQDVNTILVEVKDSGCGIPVENIKNIFTHFFTSKADGLGMGLSISRSIVEAHGGCLDAKNNPDHGATFYFTIPVGAKDSLLNATTSNLSAISVN